MLNTATQIYTSAGFSAAEDIKSVYFSDSVIDPLVTRVRQDLPGMFQAHLAQEQQFAMFRDNLVPDPPVTLERSKALIIEALHDFDPALGEKAQEILHSSRLEAQSVPPGQAKVMCNIATGYDEEDGQNPHDYSIIKYDHDGTIGATVYLAHELGHAIADDYQQESGHSYRDNPAHMAEPQAYIVQNIVYDYLKSHPDPHIAQAARDFFTIDMARNIYDIPVSLAAGDALEALEQGEDRNPSAIFAARYGEGWQEFVTQYQEAGQVFEAMNTVRYSEGKERRQPAIEKLQNEYHRLHERPVSMLVAAGITQRLQEADLHTKRQISEMLLGRQGPKKMNEALARTGIERPEDMDCLAQDILKHAVASILSPEAGIETGLSAQKLQPSS